MKIFTRVALAVAMTLSASATMAQYDLAVTGIATVATSSGQIAPGIETLLTISIENLGADIPENTTFSVIALNGTDTISVNHDWTFVNGDYPNGATGTVESNYFTLPAAPPNISLCGVVIIHIPDTDSANNFSCSNYTMSTGATPDITAQVVNINEPTDLDGFDIYGGDEDPDPITDVNIAFVNSGNTIFPAGYGITYGFTFDGTDNNNFLGTLTEDLAPGDTSIRPSVDPDFTVPTEVGGFTLCGYFRGTDTDNSNDTACTGFTLIDTYVPPPPIGIEEDIAGAVKVFYANQSVWVRNVNTPLDVTVSDMQGRTVAQTSLIEDGSIPMDGVTSGVYFIQTANTATGKVTAKKFVVR